MSETVLVVSQSSLPGYERDKNKDKADIERMLADGYRSAYRLTAT